MVQTRMPVPGPTGHLARVLSLILALALPGAVEARPERVVSINLCTDQLAMMLAAPAQGDRPRQLISVSITALDPLSSSMVEEARSYRPNFGSAEQVFLMDPDLVLAGTYSPRATVALLRRLGIRVVEVAPVNSLEGVSTQIHEVAAALGREAEGAALAAAFDAGLAALAEAQPPGLPPAKAALYYPNGYTPGAGTLADEVLAQSGFTNIATTAGVRGGGILPMELLVLADPDLVVTAKPYPGASRSEEVLSHPALADLKERAGVVTTSDADWICGTPHILRAIAAMGRARKMLEAGG